MAKVSFLEFALSPDDIVKFLQDCAAHVHVANGTRRQVLGQPHAQCHARGLNGASMCFADYFILLRQKGVESIDGNAAPKARVVSLAPERIISSCFVANLDY